MKIKKLEKDASLAEVIAKLNEVIDKLNEDKVTYTGGAYDPNKFGFNRNRR